MRTVESVPTRDPSPAVFVGRAQHGSLSTGGWRGKRFGEGCGKVDAVSCPPMKTAITLRRLAVSALAATTIGVGPVGHIVDAGRSGPEVPGRIDVEDGNKVFLVGHAVGVQIYRCNSSATGSSWGLVAPRADLYGDNGKVIVKHYGGPTWQAKDGSKVLASRVDGVVMDERAIPWLLLKADSNSAGSDGDRLIGTTFIQRVATTGGMAPDASTCNSETADDLVEIPYTADYYFWKATGN